jgi:glucose/arabinose dehydrogenase
MSKRISYGVILLFLGAIVYVLFMLFNNEVPATKEPQLNIDSEFIFNDMEEITVPVQGSGEPPKATSSQSGVAVEEVVPADEEFPYTVIAENLTIPWDIAFLPNSNILITERGGSLIEFDIASSTFTEVEVPDVLHVGEGGLLGMVLHPDFESNRYLYLYRTAMNAGKSINAVVRYTYTNRSLNEETVILDNIPGAFFHDGGRMAFGPDGFLYVATGDAQNPELSQNTSSLAGKILRIDENGGIPQDNPFSNEVYSYGHRNPQGITWDDAGALWSTEHGRSGARSGLDELNLIIKGENYGWSESQGDIVVEGTVGPVIHSGPNITWAPASATFVAGSIFFGGLRGETLYEAVERGITITELKTHYVGEFGRIRTTALGPDGMLYIMTSNRDGRASGKIAEGDDKLIRVDISARYGE